MTSTLSIVIPVYNEREQLPATIAAAERAVDQAAAAFDTEFVVADDGSTDGGAEVAAACASAAQVRVVRLNVNRGRFAARTEGLRAAGGDFVLFLDTGVELEPDALSFVAEQLTWQRNVWNGHTRMATNGALSGFWSAVSEIAYAAYLGRPRTTSFGADEFDRFPKGLGCFFAPRELMVEAFASFKTMYRDSRHANDDAPILRRVATRERIWISPRFACRYRPRTTVRLFVRHAYHRGTVFVDGHGRRESRFFPLVVGFYPLSFAALLLAVRRPVTVPALAGACSGGAWLLARRTPARPHAAAFATVAPLYAIAHGLGMWRGLAMAISQRLRHR